MKLPRRNFLHLAAGIATLPAVSRITWAQAYPSRPVRIIVGFPAGGGADIVARLIGQWLSERLGQQLRAQGHQARGIAGGSGQQVRARHQRRDRQDPWANAAADAYRPRRRGD